MHFPTSLETPFLIQDAILCTRIYKRYKIILKNWKSNRWTSKLFEKNNLKKLKVIIYKLDKDILMKDCLFGFFNINKIRELIMTNRKIIVINEEMDKVLGSICDAALKGAGMQMMPAVNAVIEAVAEEPETVLE